MVGQGHGAHSGREERRSTCPHVHRHYVHAIQCASRSQARPPGQAKSALPLAGRGTSLRLFFASTYAVCMLYGLVASDAGVYLLLPVLLPEFTWLTGTSFFVGLVWSLLYGWHAALVPVQLVRRPFRQATKRCLKEAPVMLDNTRPPEPRSLPHNEEKSPERGSRFGSFWLCLATGLIAIVAIIWLFGLTWWTALVAALVIGCPVMMVWMLLGGFDR